MLTRITPFKLTTHFRGWSRVLTLCLGGSMLLNFGLIYSQIKTAQNFATPRIVLQAPSGVVLPVAAGAFVWTPNVARDFVKLFLPILYTFSSTGTPPLEMWGPFINPQLLKMADERFRKNHSRIETEGLNQTLLVRETIYDPESDSVQVTAELRLINKAGQITRTPISLTVELISNADPLNPYGHSITNVR